MIVAKLRCDFLKYHMRFYIFYIYIIIVRKINWRIDVALYIRMPNVR